MTHSHTEYCRQLCENLSTSDSEKIMTMFARKSNLIFILIEHLISLGSHNGFEELKTESLNHMIYRGK